MSLVSWVKKELARIGMQKNRKLLFPQRRLTHSTSLSTSAQIREVVVAADLQCQECQKRVSGILSQIDDVESIVFHVFEKKVTVIRKSTADS